MFTRLSYLYRDASNYKVGTEYILTGTITNTQIQKIITSLYDVEDNGGSFIPTQIGLVHPGPYFDQYRKFAPNDPDSDDHVFCELTKDDFELIKNRESLYDKTGLITIPDNITVKKLVQEFKTAHKNGWSIPHALRYWKLLGR